jgi:hypothetical protein
VAPSERALDHAEVDACAARQWDEPERLPGVERHEGLAGPDVRGASGDDGERGLAMGEPIGDLVDGTVAATRGDHFDATLRGLGGECHGVARRGGRPNLDLPAGGAQRLARRPEIALLVRSTGARVANDQQ